MKDQGLTIIGFEDPMKNNIPTTELVIPDYFEGNKIIEISVKAFKEQKNILTVKIPASILFIDATAFEGCTNLEKIEVDQQNAVYFTKNGILYKKENKAEYIVPENLKSDNKEIAIDEKSMANLSSVQATKMQEAATTDFQYELINNNTEVKIISYLGAEIDVTVPELIEGKPVTELYGYIGGKNSEYHPVFNENVLRIKIPKTIKTINEYAFQGKSSLEYINVDPQNKNFISQEGVLYTTDYKVLIYYPCKKEGKNYEVLEGVEKITGGAFRNASKLEKIILPKSLKTILNNSFSNCAALQSIKTSSEYIGEFAFAYCENLSTVQLVEGVKEIDDYAFRNCTNLKSVNFPNSLEKLRNYAFENCISLDYLVMPKNVTSIKKEDGSYDNSYLRTFLGCTGLTNVRFQEGVKILDLTETFKNCTSLKKVDMSLASVWNLDGTFTGCSSLEQISVSANTEILGRATFSECDSLKELCLGNKTQKYQLCKTANLEKLYVPSVETEIINPGSESNISASYYIPKAIIYGKVGSNAEKFANENGIPFVALSESSIPLQIKAFTTTPTNQQEVGSPVQLHVTGEGGTGYYQYKFTVRDSSGKSALLKDYDSNNSFTWIPSAIGNKTLYIDIRDSGGNTICKEVSYKIASKLNGSLSANPSGSTVSGDKVILTAQGSGGTGVYQYKFIVENAKGKFSKIRDFSSARSVVWTPGAIGVKKLHVDIKDSSGKVVRKTISYTVTDNSIKVTSFTANPSNQQASGSKVQLKAAAVGGNGYYRYKFIVKNSAGKFALIRDFSSSNTCTWTPGATGTKTLYVDVKDSAGHTVRKGISYKVKAKLNGSLTASPGGSAVSGNKVRLTAQGSGGTGVYQYKFIVENASGKFSKIRDFASARSVIWTPGATGAKKLHVDIKDSSGNVVRISRNFQVYESEEGFYESEVLRLVNVERKKVGLSPLVAKKELTLAAEKRAEEITQNFSHTRPDATSCFTVLGEYGINYWSAGENIAAGYGTPEAVVAGWMKSEGHRENILNASYKYLGVGLKEKSSGYRYYWVQLFIDQ